jgi:MFS family permease
VAGALVQLLSAPLVIAVDAVSFLLSVVCSFRIEEPSRRPQAMRSGRPEFWPQLTEGLRQLFGNPILSALAVSATVGAVAGSMQGPLVLLYMVRELRLSPVLVGLALTVAGVASVAGTLVATAFSHWLGLGRKYIAGQLIASLAGFALATAGGPPTVVAILLIVGQLLSGLGFALYGVPQRTLRQALVPEHLLGRVNATWRTLVIGGQTVGALLGGILGTGLGLRPTLVISSAGMLVGLAWGARSAVKSVSSVPG